MAWVIWHRQHGEYIGHKMNPKVGRETPRFTWKGSGTKGIKYASEVEADAEIERKKLKRCTAREEKEKT